VTDGTDIWFRTRMTVGGTFVHHGESLTLSFDRVTVVLSYGEHPRDATQETMLLEARSKVAPPPPVARFLIASTEKATSPASAEVWDFGDAVLADHLAACRRVLELVRWRHRFESPHTPYSSLGSEWSTDGAAWHPLPTRVRATVRGVYGFRLTSATETAVDVLIQAGATEPVAHQLLREAIDVSTANPRSSLVICIAAIESGFKHLVADLVPDCAWLMENVPAPPLAKMLSDYMPTLPVRARIGGAAPSPPKYARRLVAVGVEARNKVAHTGVGTMSADDLGKLLDAAWDLLYLFDYYSGNEWALGKISEGFRRALNT
jgi:hypothetical protein